MLLDLEPKLEKEDLKADEKIYDLLPSEFGETPPGYISVYKHIAPNSVEFVAKNGLKPKDNRMIEKQPDKEKLLEAMRPSRIVVGRINCVYAFPEIPSQNSSMANLHRGVLMEILIDPENAYVADARWLPDVAYVERGGASEDSELIRMLPVEPWMVAIAKEYAGRYWESVIPYKSWQQLSAKEKSKFSDPEVLINGEIPLKHMRRLN